MLQLFETGNDSAHSTKSPSSSRNLC